MKDSKRKEMLVLALGGIKYDRDVPARDFTSFRIGGEAALLAEPRNEAELCRLIQLARENDYPYFVFGNGSNLLVQDEPLEALFIRLGDRFSDFYIEGVTLTASAGALLCSVAKSSVNSGFMGLEWAAGIPGSVGGGIAMNAGAYGGEIKQVLRSVRLYKDGGIFEHEIMPQDLDYRYSAFSFPNAVVLSGRFELSVDDGSAKARMEEYSRQRKAKQPLELPSAGSAFKRPPGHFAARLIEDAGLKGFRIGGAMVSEKHAGFIVNAGGASFADVKELMEAVEERVYAEFGVRLEPEVKLITKDALINSL